MQLKMKNYSATLIRVGNIAGMLYRQANKNKSLVIYGLGAPVVPDNGNLPDAPAIMKYEIDLFVPDYIGYGRSDGKLTPKSCINTFLNLYKYFSQGCIGQNHYEQSKIKLKYNRIIFIGRSFGGTYVPLLPKYNPDIKELCLIFPAVDNKSCGSIPGEETNEDFLRSMKKDGYHHLYRGILSEAWKKHLNNEDGLSPMDNIEYLDQAKLFIGHGKQDKCIHYSKSVLFYEKLIKTFPDNQNQYKLKLYPSSGHTELTSNKAVEDFLKWLKIKKYKVNRLS
jgi:esterase/lipase